MEDKEENIQEIKEILEQCKLEEDSQYQVDNNSNSNDTSKKSSKRTNKILLIIVSIPICLGIIVYILLFCLFGIPEMKKNREKKMLEEEAEKNVSLYLKEKYPERNFEIIEIEVDALYNGFVYSHWDPRVEVSIKENDKEYVVYIDTLDNPIVPSCSDNVQEEEIKNAIIQKIDDITNVKSDEVIYKIEMDGTVYGHKFCFSQKFNGDITDFLERENQSYIEALEVYVYCSYVNGKEKFIKSDENNRFMQLLNMVVLINSRETIKLDGYTYYYVDWVKSALVDRNIPLNSIYIYDKESGDFKDISD